VAATATALIAVVQSLFGFMISPDSEGDGTNVR
jgi:hypothetical protein